MEIPESTLYDTFSGFILDRIGKIPREKEEISLGPFTAIVNKMDGNRICEFVIKKKPSPPVSPAATEDSQQTAD